ncbi:MAG: hypothetical protein ACJ8C4_10595 [Gemmataceae bacterium]
MKLTRRRVIIAVALLALLFGAAIVFAPRHLTIAQVEDVSYDATESEILAMFGPPNKSKYEPKFKESCWIASDGVIRVGFDYEGRVRFRGKVDATGLEVLKWRFFGLPF